MCRSTFIRTREPFPGLLFYLPGLLIICTVPAAGKPQPPRRPPSPSAAESCKKRLRHVAEDGKGLRREGRICTAGTRHAVGKTDPDFEESPISCNFRKISRT